MQEHSNGDCASAMEIKCFSDGNKVLQRWKLFSIAEAQMPRKRSCIALTPVKPRKMGLMYPKKL